MAAKIVWSQNALDDLEKVKEYLEKNWSEKALTSFLDKLVSKLNVIESFPEIGRVSTEFSHRRRFVITRHNLLIYSVHGEEIVIEALFDTRQDDKEL